MAEIKEKILLLNPPGDKLYLRDEYCSAVAKADYYWPPIDLLVLSGTLSDHYEIEVIDAIAEKLNPDKCYQRIIKNNYAAIIFLTGAASWKADLSFVSRLKGSKDLKLIGNGDVLLAKAKELMGLYPALDGILLDFSTDDIVKFLAGNHEAVKNMVFRYGGDIVDRGRDLSNREFAYPVPRHELFPLKRYLLPHGRRFPFTIAIMNFGCPFKCGFCIASTLGYKFRNVDNAMEELRHIQALGIKEVYFEDFTFEANRKNTENLCRCMIEENLDISWVCSSRVNTVDSSLLKLMKGAGCHTIMFGVESGDEGILRRYNKDITLEQIDQAFRLCKEFSIRTLAHFIIGLPGETDVTAKKTIEFAKKLDCDFAAFNTAIPAFGTRLRKESIENGYVSEETDMDVLDSSQAFPTIGTEALSKDRVLYWRNRAIREFYFRPGYILRKLLAARTLYGWRILFRNGLALLRISK